jgi:hypothetical protein
MAFDEGLAQRIRDALEDVSDPWEERRMFGGLCFMVRDHMAFGIVGEELMVRLGKERWEAALKRKGAREMDFTGRSLKGMVYVGTDGIDDDDDLGSWLELGLANARSLPPKKPKKPKRPQLG